MYGLVYIHCTHIDTRLICGFKSVNVACVHKLYGVHRQRVGELLRRRSSFAVRRSSTSSSSSSSSSLLWQQLTKTTNEPTNEWTDERTTNRRTNGRTNGRTTNRTNGVGDEWQLVLPDSAVGEENDEQANEQTANKQRERQTATHGKDGHRLGGPSGTFSGTGQYIKRKSCFFLKSIALICGTETI